MSIYHAGDMPNCTEQLEWMKAMSTIQTDGKPGPHPGAVDGKPGTCGACRYYIRCGTYGGKCGQLQSIFGGDYRGEREKPCHDWKRERRDRNRSA